MSHSFIPPAAPKHQRLLPPEDCHVARLYSLVDLGTTAADGQFAKDKNGNQRYKREIMLTWELPSCRAVFKEGGSEEPFVISKTFTFSLGSKSNLRKFVESWRGKSMTDDEAAKFDILVLLGQPCLLTIEHEEAKSGNMYASIVAISRVPKGMECAFAHNPKIFYHINDLDQGNYSKLPEWIQKKIQASEEWKNKDDVHENHEDDRPPVDDAAIDELNRKIDAQTDDNVAF